MTVKLPSTILIDALDDEDAETVLRTGGATPASP
jgi:hypothetical protein